MGPDSNFSQYPQRQLCHVALGVPEPAILPYPLGHVLSAFQTSSRFRPLLRDRSARMSLSSGTQISAVEGTAWHPTSLWGLALSSQVLTAPFPPFYSSEVVAAAFSYSPLCYLSVLFLFLQAFNTFVNSSLPNPLRTVLSLRRFLLTFLPSWMSQHSPEK